MRRSAEFICAICGFWDRQIALSPHRSDLFHRILIKRLFVFFSLRMLSFICRQLSGAKIQDDDFDTWRFRLKTYVT